MALGGRAQVSQSELKDARSQALFQALQIVAHAKKVSHPDKWLSGWERSNCQVQVRDSCPVRISLSAITLAALDLLPSGRGEAAAHSANLSHRPLLRNVQPNS